MSYPHQLQDKIDRFEALREEIEDDMVDLFRKTAPAILLREQGRITHLEIMPSGQSFSMFVRNSSEVSSADVERINEELQELIGIEEDIDLCILDYGDEKRTVVSYEQALAESK